MMKVFVAAFLGLMVASQGLSAAETDCKAAFVGCQQRTGNPLECRKVYASCIEPSAAIKRDKSAGEGCEGLIEYRDKSLFKLLDKNWPRQSQSLGISEATKESLEENLRAVEKTTDDLEFWSRVSRVSMQASSVMISFKRIPIIGQAISDGECAASVHSLANSRNSDFSDTSASCVFKAQECIKAAAGDSGAFGTAFFATGCVMKLAGNRVGKSAKSLYDVLAGTHDITRELIALRSKQ
jgi:hypothetical protein